MLRVLLNRYRGESPAERLKMDDVFLRNHGLSPETVAHEDFGKDRNGMYVSAFTFHEKQPMSCETQMPQENKAYHPNDGVIPRPLSALERAADEIKRLQGKVAQWEAAQTLVYDQLQFHKGLLADAQERLQEAVDAR